MRNEKSIINIRNETQPVWSWNEYGTMPGSDWLTCLLAFYKLNFEWMPTRLHFILGLPFKSKKSIVFGM